MGLLFYDGINGVGAFYSVDSNGNMTLLHEDDGWRKTWSQIVPTGFFYPPDNLTPGVKHLSLFFYDAQAGEGFIYNHDDAGKMTLIKSHTGLRHSWKQIIPGNWGGTRGLLFYDAQAGEGAFYSIDAQGNMAHIKTNSGWPKNLVVIVPGSWNPPQTGLLFYDDVQGVGEFYTVDNQGNIHLLKRHEGWRHTWYHNIFPVGLLGNTGNQSLLFYDGPARDGTFYNVDAQGNLSFVHQESGWRGWSQIIPIFDVSKALPKAPGQEPVLFRNGLLFYDAGNRVGEFYVLDSQGHPNLIQQKQGWRNSWTNIIETDMLMLGKAPGGR